MDKPQPFIKLHKNGSIWTRGKTLADTPTGYWEWFRRDGTRLRSGHFDAGRQVGDWTTYDRFGHVYKVTLMDPTPRGAAGKD